MAHHQRIRRRGDGVEVVSSILLDVKKVAFFKEAKNPRTREFLSQIL